MASRDDSVWRSGGPEFTDVDRLRTGAKALVTASERALLVKERHADGSTFWTLPGGGVRDREWPVDGLRRELAEELSCRAVVGDPVADFWYHHQSTDAVTRYEVFACSLLSSPTPALEEGILDSRWVDPESPPATTLPQVRQVIRADARS